ncbi:MAG: LytTR family transcriptional regulator DNA-binding domain-containing protein [Bacteroidota bacterium]
MITAAKSIAILPFRNLSRNATDDFFSDGLTEELMALLSRVAGLQVTARTSAFSFKGQDRDAREIGRRLNVSHVLEGSVRIHAGQVRVATQLIDARTGFVLESTTFARKLDDLFAIQDELAAQITTQLRKQLALAAVPERKSGVDPQAYADYLKGNFFRNQRLPDPMRQAIQSYQRALRRVPDFPAAHAALSRCYTFLGLRSRLPLKEAQQQSRYHALRAVELAPDLVEAQLAHAISALYAWEWDRCRNAIIRATELNPGHAEVHLIYARYLKYCGLTPQAIREMELALRLDPLSTQIKVALTEMYYMDRQYDLAIASANQYLKETPDLRAALYNRGWTYLALGQYEKALVDFQRIEALIDNPNRRIGSTAIALALLGQEVEARQILDHLWARSRSETGHGLSIDFAAIHGALGSWDTSLEWLEKALPQHYGTLPLTWTYPFWDPIRDDARFVAILEKTGLPAHIRKIQGAAPQTVVTLQTDTRETLTLALEDLLYAQALDNYSRIVWREHGRVRRKTLRVTLKHLTEQLANPGFARVHKSFFVNLNAQPKRQGNLRSMELIFPDVSEPIPVSRRQARRVMDALGEG